MQPNPSEYDQTIGSLLLNATSNPVKAVLQGCDPKKTYQQNVNTLSSNLFTREKLMETVAYLQESFRNTKLAPLFVVNPDERNKKGYAKIILNCILKLTGIECMKCSVIYKPHDPSNVTDISCVYCQRPSHSGCYNSFQFDYEIGVVFTCKLCMPPAPPCVENPSCNAAKKSDKPPPDKEPKAVENSENSLKLSPPPKEITPPPEEGKTSTPKSEKQKPESNKKVGSNTDETTFCPLLLKFECPHGISGKNCEFFHPTRCFKYQTYGPQACQKDNCKYYHPKFCRNSLAIKACFDPQCSGLHLPGTKRKNNPQAKSKPHDRDGRRDPRERDKATKNATKVHKTTGTCTAIDNTSSSSDLLTEKNNRNFAEPERESLPANDVPEPALTSSQFFQYLEELRAALREDLKTEMLQQIQLAMASVQTRTNTAFFPPPPNLQQMNPAFMYNSQCPMETPNFNIQQAFAFPPQTQTSQQTPMYTQPPTAYPSGSTLPT
jgi:hypothetical protein